jgi:putative glycosyltransferase (TIGR04348 family)
MARIVIVTPARAGTRTGNRHTAQRWAAMLRGAGHRVAVATEWDGRAADLLVALHAKRSHASIVRFSRERPSAPLVVALTGTDLYRDLPVSPEARRSLVLASRLVVLQEDARRKLAPRLRRKARIVYQSSDVRLRRAPPRDRFRLAVVGHLREEKDPFRAALALSHLDDEGIEVVQIGGALQDGFAEQAARLAAADARYRWLGSQPHLRALRWIARSHLLVVSSIMEGGANVICEAARLGTPVIASRVSGNLGMLGRKYPGYYRLGDERGLARLIERAAKDRRFYHRLGRALQARRARFAPAAERRALRAVVREALALTPAAARSSAASSPRLRASRGT